MDVKSVIEKNIVIVMKKRPNKASSFCLYKAIGIKRISKSNTPSDPTAKRAILNIYLKERIELIERITHETDPYLHEYILRAVTEGLSYTFLKNKLDMPCGKDMYYDRYRKFFWLLGNSRK